MVAFVCCFVVGMVFVVIAILQRGNFVHSYCVYRASWEFVGIRFLLMGYFGLEVIGVFAVDAAWSLAGFGILAGAFPVNLVLVVPNSGHIGFRDFSSASARLVCLALAMASFVVPGS